MTRLTRDEILSADRVLKLLAMSEHRGATPQEADAFRAKAQQLAERNGYAGRMRDYRDEKGSSSETLP